MPKKFTFCENCRDDVLYNEFEISMIGKLRNVDYHYIGKEAYCERCGNPVYVHEINDYNLEKLYDEYRKQNNIIPLKHIRELTEKYAIGKRPLSLLLGWGEQTFSRYYDGDIPTKQYSDILTQIHDNPNAYYEILKAGKENLKSEIAYEKSRKAVEALINPENIETKISLATKYLLTKCEDITPLALQKALYYIQGFYVAFCDSFIFSEDCEAWVHGPVYRDIYLCYKNYHFDPITFNDKFDDSILTTQEKTIFDNVIKYFCCYSGKILENFTHNEIPWISARSDLPAYAPSEHIITRESIRDYFTAVKVKYNMMAPADIRVYAQECFAVYK